MPCKSLDFSLIFKNENYWIFCRTTGVDVYLGAWNRLDKTEKYQQIIFVQAKNVIVHEDWNPDTITNDISLIKLPVAIEFNGKLEGFPLNTSYIFK